MLCAGLLFEFVKDELFCISSSLGPEMWAEVPELMGMPLPSGGDSFILPSLWLLFSLAIDLESMELAIWR